MTDKTTLHTASDRSPILLVPFMWVGDFVRCHSALRILRDRYPDRPIDVLSSTLCAPLTRLMPEVRQAIIADFPRGRISLRRRRMLAERLRQEHYGSAFLMLGTFKDAIAPWLAGIPERTGWLGEFRYVLLTDIRHGEKQITNLGERCASLVLPKNAPMPNPFPAPKLTIDPAALAQWRLDHGLPADGKPILAIAPGCNDPARTWPIDSYADLTQRAVNEGIKVIILGGPAEKQGADLIMSKAGHSVRDFTGTDLYEAAFQAAAADVLVANDSGLLHLGAAVGTSAIALYLASTHEHTGPLNTNVEPLVADLSQSADHIDPGAVFERVRHFCNIARAP